MTVPIPGGPAVYLEIAPGDTPLTVSPSWEDVTATVKWDLTCNRGRRGGGEIWPAGDMEVSFDDPDRLLDGTNTAGAYYPYIRPRLPIRFRATYNAVDYDLWRGHVSTPSHSYPPDGDDTSTFECDDLFAVMATVDTSERSAWAATLEALQPVAWWRLGDTSPVEGTTATDETGAYDGVYRGPDGTSVDGLVTDDQSGAFHAGLGSWVQLDPNATTVLHATDQTVVLRVQTPAIGGSNRVLFVHESPIDAGMVGFGYSSMLYVEATTGKLKFFSGDASIYEVTSSGRIDDDQPHTVVLTFDVNACRMYIDGVFAGEHDPAVGTLSQAISTGIDYSTILRVGVSLAGGDHADNTIVDEVALIPQTLTAAQALDLHEAAEDSWAGETSGSRIARAAALAGIPTGLQDIAAGISTVSGWSGGASTIDIAQEANRTEQGILVISGDGKLTFEDRHEHLDDAVAATFGDTGSDLTYAGHATAQGERLIVNRATFSSPAGSVTVEDATSIAVYGVHSTRRSTIDDDRNNLVAGAQYLVGRSSGPEQRIVALTIDPTYDPVNLWPEVLGRRIGDRITVNRTPSSGSAISQTVVIVGIQHRLLPDQWLTTWTLSDADAANVAISDVSTSDGPALAAF